MRKFGSKGTGNGQFIRAEGITVDKNTGRIYITDAGDNPSQHNIKVFDNTGKFLFKFGGQGDENGQFFNPYDVKIDNAGDLWVADQNNNRLQKFDNNGNHLLTKSIFPGAKPATLNLPECIAFDSSWNMYLADTDNDRIIKLDKDMNFIKEWGKQGNADGDFQNPHSIAMGPDGNLYVSDDQSVRIQVFSPDGKFLRKWGKEGNRPGEMTNPKESVNVDQNGIVYQVNGDLRWCIIVFDSFGKLLFEIGRKGSRDGEFNEPERVDFDADGNLYVTDSFNYRIQVFEPIRA